MRLNTFILTLCVCVLYASAASIASDKKIDALDNVDLDDVAIEPELVDHAPVKDVDNSLRKTIVDIPVKVVDEPTVLDENSNDYIPKNDDNIVVKRVEIDLDNPGLPQRQEHETQNPENYGELEKALFGIKKTVIDTQNVFNQGFQEVSNSFKTLFKPDEDLPSIHNNLENLKKSFTDQIEKLNKSIISNLNPDTAQSDKVSEKKLKIAESHLENLRKNFNVGVDTLTEGVEVLTIIKEEDEAIKTKSILKEEEEGGKQNTDTNPSSSEATPAQSTAAPVSQNPVIQFLTNFQNGMANAFSNFTSAIQNNFAGNQQTGTPGGTGGGNPIINFFQGISVPNIIQGQNPTINQTPGTQQSSQAPPAGAQSDTAVTSAPAPAPPQWGPQAILQQVQNTWQNFINPNPPQNTQQDTPQTQPPAQQPAGPIAQAFQNIVQFIQRPGQANAQQQPANPAPAQQQPANPAPAQQTSPQSSNAASNEANNVVPPQPDAPAKPNAAPARQQTQAAPQTQPQPVQTGPIQQLVQNNPIIKGIQSAVQRIQGTPNSETPRNEIINESIEEPDIKGHNGNQGTNQGNISSGCSGVENKIEEKKEENVIPKINEEILEGQIKAEEAKISSLSDKTE